MRHEEIQVGMHVRCTYAGPYYRNKTGQVMEIPFDQYQAYRIQWDDYLMGVALWYMPQYLEPMDPQDQARAEDQRNREAHALQYL